MPLGKWDGPGEPDYFKRPVDAAARQERGLPKTDFKTADEYIATLPKAVQPKLNAVRQAIRTAVPQAEEFISYQMPAYKFRGQRLLYFCAFKNHYSLFAITPGVLSTFKGELAGYERTSKGTLRFPLDEPVPVALIRAIAKFRAQENVARGPKT
jgi:uncharacterized protein YdhG (YjbR/CyaY superfamily)